MPTLSTAFTIVADSGVREGGSTLSPTATVKFKVAWGSRYAFVREVCGSTIGGPGAITRTIPLPYPPSPNLYAKPDFDIEPLGKMMAVAHGDDVDGHGAYAIDWVKYPYAIITINFGVPDFAYDNSDPSGVPWTTTTFDVSGEFLTLPDSVYKFSGGTPVGAPVGKIIPQVAISFKRHWVPYLPVAAAFNLVGKVNNATFAIGDFVCPAETLLFLGSPNQRQADSVGSVAQEVEYKMSYRPISWNKFLHPNGTSGFQYLTDGNGAKVYDAGDFTTLP